jgi:hypothetical protein
MNLLLNGALSSLLIMFCYMHVSFGQFSTGGTGKYQRQIYWLPWHWSTGNNLGLASIVPSSNPTITYTPSNLPAGSIVMNGTYT